MAGSLNKHLSAILLGGKVETLSASAAAETLRLGG